jgi:hypothetical protein
MSAAFTTPAAKKEGSSRIVGSWVVFFPQSARLPHPEGWRAGLGSGLAMTFNFYIVFLGFMSESSSLPRPYKSATQSPMIVVLLMATEK